jgi:hypothetical protein
MKKTLLQDGVALMVEVTEDHALVYDLLKDHGYALFDEAKKTVLNARTISGNVFCLKEEDPRTRLVFGQDGRA